MVSEAQVWKILESVNDPEVPVLNILDLGIVREVSIENDHINISITPTYTGCPAMKVIEWDIISRLKQEGIDNFNIKTILSPAWTTDWMSEAGRKKLKDYGIAPPQYDKGDPTALFQAEKKIACPHCDSSNTKMVSEFGSTACKAFYKCLDCLEPFDYFKCH